MNQAFNENLYALLFSIVRTGWVRLIPVSCWIPTMSQRALFLLSGMLIAPHVMAFQDNYMCKVKQVVELSDAGTLGEPISPYKTLLGQSFLVNRTSGKLDGAVSWLKTSELEQVTIISNGKEKNDFKSISVARPPTSVATYLHIQEVGTGKVKPFYLATGRLIFGGTCE
jgi:hypothetical protein